MASYGKGVLQIDESGIFLDSGLSPQEFARARLGQYISDCGYLLVPQKETQDYQVNEFRFSGAQASEQVGKNAKLSENETIRIVAPFFAGKPLLGFLEGSNREDAIKAVNAVCAAVEWNLQQINAANSKNTKIEDATAKNIPELLNCGPLGILVGDDGSVLFLPFALFERSMLAREDKITSELYGCWTNTSLNKEDGWRFTLSTCAYTALTGKKAFSELHIEKRTEDYYDNNFIPLEYCLFVNADDVKLTELIHIINYNLELTGSAYQSIQPLKKKSVASSLVTKALNNRSSSGNKAKSIPLPLPIEKPSHEVISPKFIDAQDKFLEKKAKELKRKRFLRKHSAKISIVAMALVVIGLATGSIIKTNLEKPTTENMNPHEVVQTFYTALNNLDSIQLDSCGKNKAIKGYSTMVSSLFVTSKMREAYEQALPFLTPGQWVNTHNPLEFWVFGLTHLDIVAESSWNDIPKKDDTVNFTVRFNTVVTNGTQNYEITAYTDTLTLTYGKKYWQITDLSSEANETTIDNEAFIKDMNVALEIIKADTTIEPIQQGEELVKILGETYLWFPTAEEVLVGLEELSAYLLFPPATAQ